MGSHVTCLLKQEDPETFVACFVGELLQADRGGETSRAATDDHDVDFVGFAGFEDGDFIVETVRGMEAAYGGERWWGSDSGDGGGGGERT